jgi:hypothetical protein
VSWQVGSSIVALRWHRSASPCDPIRDARTEVQNCVTLLHTAFLLHELYVHSNLGRRSESMNKVRSPYHLVSWPPVNCTHLCFRRPKLQHCSNHTCEYSSLLAAQCHSACGKGVNLVFCHWIQLAYWSKW